jgi:hypothetical protein
MLTDQELSDLKKKRDALPDSVGGRAYRSILDRWVACEELKRSTTVPEALSKASEAAKKGNKLQERYWMEFAKEIE